MLWGQIHAAGPADDRVIADAEARQPMTRPLATDGLLMPGLRRLPRGPVLPGSHARPGRGIAARAVACPAGRQRPGGSGRSSVSLTCPAARSQPGGHLARRRPPDKPCRTQPTAGSGHVDDGITPSDGEVPVERTPSRLMRAPLVISARPSRVQMEHSVTLALSVLPAQSTERRSSLICPFVRSDEPGARSCVAGMRPSPDHSRPADGATIWRED